MRSRAIFAGVVLTMGLLSQGASAEESFHHAAYDGLPAIPVKLGEEKPLADGLHVRVQKIEDARSYTGTVSGAAVVDLLVTLGTQRSAFQLHFWDMAYPSAPQATSRQGGLGNTVTVGQYQISLVSLVPWSRAGERIDPSACVATLVVDSAKDYQRKRKAIDAAQAELQKRLKASTDYFPTGLRLAEGQPGAFIVTFDQPYRAKRLKIQVTVEAESGAVLSFRGP